MIEAKEIQIMQQKVLIKLNPESIKMPKYRTKATGEIANSVACPRGVDEVYSLGVSMQNYIGAIYLELTDLSKFPKKNLYTGLALHQLKVKKEIEKLGNYNLDRMLEYFYNNRGPIMEPPVSEESIREIQPAFDRNVAAFLTKIDFLVNRTFKGEMSPRDLDTEISRQIVAMYTAMRNLFHDDEMQQAFDELINVRMTIPEDQ